MFCTECGAEIPDGAEFCTNCGAPVKHDKVEVAHTPPAYVVPQAQAPQPQQYAQAPQASEPPRRRRHTAAIVAVAIVAVALVVGGGTFYLVQQGMLGGTASVGTSDASSSGTTANVNAAGPTTAASSTNVTTATVPDLSGLTVDAASSQLSSVGLSLGNVSSQYSDTVGQGSIISQSVSAGSTMGSGGSVDVVVSQGKAATKTEHRYTLVHQAMTWSEAKAYCESQGGYLATITSADEYQKVKDAITDGDVTVCWIGGYADGSTWRWVTGEDFSGYDAWASGEPNDTDGGEDRLVMLKSKGTWGWYDVPNDVSETYAAHRMGFVMETEVQASA